MTTSFTIGNQMYQGNNISIRGGVITIDGVVVDNAAAQNAVEIRVTKGEIHNLDTDLSVSCNNVTGNVNAGGSVSCDDIGGSLSAGGSVSCDDVMGTVTAGGSIARN